MKEKKRLINALAWMIVCLLACFLMPLFLVFLFGLLDGLEVCRRGSDLFYIQEDHEFGNGRSLVANNEGNDYWEKNGIGRLDSTCLMPWHDRLMELDNVEEYELIDSFFTLRLCPIYVHRTSSRVDTFYCYNSIIDIGYIQRDAKTKDWMVLECKSPKLVLDSTYKERRSPYSSWGTLQSYSWEGQRLFFDSPLSYYWIIGRKTPHLYGPLSDKQLRIQLRRLKIPLPLTLKGRYDRYVHNYADYKGWQKNVPHEVYWPHHKSRPDKIIEQ